ncbi:tryptophan synthase, alpha subunit [Heliomicrobium modesticaldum Ice1]|uniref:Tryptophan synthase alpha chain n=1 Tax=Heliobacterium modesticaldum (strain ATCC 51547 / Ice1) TaxID=498761 RepID=B0TFQ0_HELMI|nr:tryptophan synthase subunit alpha [Heliomicrobium modesticaldum]ABZ84480.1 tryptophan synthase, alpha subunit [Heliomicrobium modesticaldum Ice1]
MEDLRGTERLTATFANLKAEGKRAFIAYVTAGDPDLETTRELVLTLEKNGASIIELGVPFSDPVADGPVIQEAAVRALAGGTTLTKVLAMVRTLRRETSIPIVLLTYYNPVLRFGLLRFAREAAASGVDGVIVADLPAEEGGVLREPLDELGLALIPLVAPTSTPERIQRIAEKARGFIYCVSLLGVTGMRSDLPPDAAALLERVRAMTDVPLALGFGISRAEHVAIVAPNCDGVIVGSAIVKLIAQNLGDRARMLAEVGAFAREMAAAVG